MFSLIKVDLSVPDHTTLSRRNSSLKIQLKRVGKQNGRVDLVIDSTGLVIHGEGRWIRHKYGKRKRRGWRKLHIGVSHVLIVANHLTDERGCDGVIALTLITQTGHIDSIVADKGYDQTGIEEVGYRIIGVFFRYSFNGIPA